MVLKEKELGILEGNNKEIINYLIFGVLTTIVNYISYFSATKVFYINYLLANIISWFISVVFAYVTNKFHVFDNKSIEFRYLIKEISLFISARLMSGGIETLFLFIFVSLLDFNDGIIKIIASVFVVIFNYFFSKFIIFKKE